MPIHPDFVGTYNSMIKKHGEKKGKQVFYAWINKMGYDETKPRPKEIKYCSYGELEYKESDKDFHVSGFVATSHPDRAESSDETGSYEGDVIPKNTLQKIVEHINNRYKPQAGAISERHDWLKGDTPNPDMPLAGVTVGTADLRMLEDGEWGVHVDTILAKTNPRYEEVKTNIKQGVYPGFSIEYLTNSFIPTVRDGKTFRLLTDIDTEGIGYANRRKIANPHAEITDFGFKEILGYETKAVLTTEARKKIPKGSFAIPEQRAYPIHDIAHARNALARVSQHGTPEEQSKVRAAVHRRYPELKKNDSKKETGGTLKMENIKKKEEEPEEKAPVEEPSKEDASSEADSGESAGKEEESEEKAEDSAEEKEFKEFQKFKEMKVKEKAKKERMAEIKEALQEIKKEPLMKTEDDVEIKEIKAFEEAVAYKESNEYRLEGTPVKDVTFTEKEAQRSNRVTIMYKEANKLLNKFPEIATRDSVRSNRSYIGRGNPRISHGLAPSAEVEFHCKEIKGYKMDMEYKAGLYRDSNKISDTDYYQTAAELADVYDATIFDQMNTAITTYGLLKKVDASGYADKYGFRARVAKNTSVGNYDESGTVVTTDPSNFFSPVAQTRIRCQIPFVFYKVDVFVSGQPIQPARAIGAIGDVCGQEIRDSTSDLLKDINTDILTGTQSGFTEGGEVLGLTYLIDDTSNHTDLYGHTRSGGNFVRLKGNYRAMSSTYVSKPYLREMMRACEAGDSSRGSGEGGADRNDLVFITHHLQRDRILGLFDDHQRILNVSPRAGFEGLPTFDGVPIHADRDCTNSVIFLVDMKHTFLAMQVAPTIERLGKLEDGDRAFVKTYFQLVGTAPGHNAKYTGWGT